MENLGVGLDLPAQQCRNQGTLVYSSQESGPSVCTSLNSLQALFRPRGHYAEMELGFSLRILFSKLSEKEIVRDFK